MHPPAVQVGLAQILEGQHPWEDGFKGTFAYAGERLPVGLVLPVGLIRLGALVTPAYPDSAQVWKGGTAGLLLLLLLLLC